MDNIERVPFSKQAVMAELALTILTEASQFALLKNEETANAVAGVTVDDWFNDRLDNYSDKVDLSAFRSARLIDRAYDYAFQVGEYWSFSPDEEYDLTMFVQSLGRTGLNGEYTPYHQRSGPGYLKTVCDMAIARCNLDGFGYLDGLTFSHLAALSSMTENAVRSSLSSEGFKTFKSTQKETLLSIEDSRRWLSKRRAFIPTISDSREKFRDYALRALKIEDQTVEEIVASVLDYRGTTMEAVAKESGLTEEAIRRVAALEIGLDEIGEARQVAAALDIDAAQFVGRVASGIVRREEFSSRMGAAPGKATSGPELSND